MGRILGKSTLGKEMYDYAHLLADSTKGGYICAEVESLMAYISDDYIDNVCYLKAIGTQLYYDIYPDQGRKPLTLDEANMLIREYFTHGKLDLVQHGLIIDFVGTIEDAYEQYQRLSKREEQANE